MHIDRDQLKQIVLETACRDFGTRTFARRQLMDAVERRLRAEAVWAEEDNGPSASAGAKSRGLATIDYAISELKREQRLANPERDRWRIPARLWPSLHAHLAGHGPAVRNGAAPDQRVAADRVRRLERVSGRAGGPPIPDEAMRRENLYDAVDEDPRRHQRHHL